MQRLLGVRAIFERKLFWCHSLPVMLCRKTNRNIDTALIYYWAWIIQIELMGRVVVLFLRYSVMWTVSMFPLCLGSGSHCCFGWWIGLTWGFGGCLCAILYRPSQMVYIQYFSYAVDLLQSDSHVSISRFCFPYQAFCTNFKLFHNFCMNFKECGKSDKNFLPGVDKSIVFPLKTLRDVDEYLWDAAWLFCGGSY